MAEEQNSSEHTVARYDVPKSMRTRKCLPRAIASVLVLGWLSIFVISSASLAKTYAAPGSPFDKLFSESPSYWGTRHSNDADTCTSFVQSQLLNREAIESNDPENKSHLELRTSGSTIVRSGEKRLLLKSSAKLGFNAFKALETVNIDLALGQGSLRVYSVAKSKKVHVRLTAGPMDSEYSFDTLPAVFLTMRGSERYSLQIPPKLSKIVQSAAIHSRPLDDIRPLSLSAFKKCKSQVETMSEAPLDSLLDISTYFQLLPPQVAIGIMDALTNESTIPSLITHKASENHDKTH